MFKGKNEDIPVGWKPGELEKFASQFRPSYSEQIDNEVGDIEGTKGCVYLVLGSLVILTLYIILR